MSRATDIEAETKPAVTQYIYPFVSPGPGIRAATRAQSDSSEPVLGVATTPDPEGARQPPVGAWEQGLQEGERRARAEFEEMLAKERESLAASVEQAARDRAAYYRNVETEVVALALAIAAKVLHREAQVDPVFLRGAVRVALGDLASTTEVKMRVHPERVAVWAEQFANPGGIEPSPKVEGDDSLRLDQCVLETSLGTTDLSWQAQLKEVEQSFLDLLEVRPERL